MAKRSDPADASGPGWSGSSSPDPLDFPQRLKEFRIQRGWSQQHLAEVLDVSQQVVSDLEKGTEALTVRHLSRLRNHVDLDAFLSEERDWDVDNVSRVLERIKNLHGGGMEETHPDRHEALKSFHRFIEREQKCIDLTGSSLKGLLTMYPEAFEAMKRQIQLGAQARILLTHPAFAVLRAFVEGRNYLMIEGEIKEAFDKYCNAFIGVQTNPDQVQVKVVLHPPTVFGIFLASQGKALINPYTLTVEAFSTQTFICRDTGSPKCTFRQYHLHHFEKPFNNDLNNQVSIDLATYQKSAEQADNPLAEACRQIDKALGAFREKGAKGLNRENG